MEGPVWYSSCSHYHPFFDGTWTLCQPQTISGTMSLAQGPHVWKRSFQSASEALAIAIMSLKKVTDSTWPGDVDHEIINSQNQDKPSWVIINIINQMALPNQTTPPSFFLAFLFYVDDHPGPSFALLAHGWHLVSPILQRIQDILTLISPTPPVNVERWPKTHWMVYLDIWLISLTEST